MYDECANKAAPKIPRCLSCAQPMQLLRRTSRFGELPDLYTFYCRTCDEWHVEEGDAITSPLPGCGGLATLAANAGPMVHLVLESHDGRALAPISEEKHEPVSDIDTVVVGGLNALDPKRPIREADI